MDKSYLEQMRVHVIGGNTLSQANGQALFAYIDGLEDALRQMISWAEDGSDEDGKYLVLQEAHESIATIE